MLNKNYKIMLNKNYKIVKFDQSSCKVTEVEFRGELFTEELCEELHGYTWESSPMGNVWFFSNKKGQVIQIKKIDYLNSIKGEK